MNSTDVALAQMIENLSSPVSPEEAAEGWTTESKTAIRKYFADKLTELNRGLSAPDFGLVRGLDAWGIGDGQLYDEALRLNRQLQ